MKKLNMALITAVTTLSLTVPTFAAPVKTNVFNNTKLNYLTAVTEKGLCNFENKADLLEYLIKKCITSGTQKPGSGNGGNTQRPDTDNNGNTQKPDTDKNGNTQKPDTDNNGNTQKPGTDNNGNTQKPDTDNGGNTQKPDTDNNGNTQKPDTDNNGNTQKPGSGNNQDTSSSSYAQRVVELVNIERAKEGLSPLTMDSKISAAAAVRAEEIKTTFSHTRPNGTSCFTALDQAGVSYRGAGENIASGQRTPEEVVTAWMNSEGHRKNIMNANFKNIGVAYSNRAWVQLFTY